MTYKKGQKVIIYGDLFKITEVKDEYLYKGCNELGCQAMIVEPRIELSYIGEADPEFYLAAKLIKENTEKLLQGLTEEQKCEIGMCDSLLKVIEIAEKVMEKFKYDKHNNTGV